MASERERYHALDGLRATMLLLGIVFQLHAGLHAEVSGESGSPGEVAVPGQNGIGVDA